MLYHYLLIKAKSPGMKDSIADDLSKSMNSLVKKVDGLEGSLVIPSCVERPDGIDIIVRMDFTDQAAMRKYLDSPLHHSVKQKSGDSQVASTAFFDSEELI